MLPELWINISANFEAIIQVFQNVLYMGELRQRWMEIKRLQIKPALYRVYIIKSDGWSDLNYPKDFNEIRLEQGTYTVIFTLNNNVIACDGFIID